MSEIDNDKIFDRLKTQREELNKKYVAQQLYEVERIKGQRSRRIQGLSAMLFGLIFTAMAVFSYDLQGLRGFWVFIAERFWVICGAGVSIFGLSLYINSLSNISDVDVFRRASLMGGDIQGGDKRSAEIGENKAPDSFKAAIVEITKSLQQQSVVYDEKASELLDAGRGYALFGLSFFFVSVVVWQVIFHFYGFSNAHIFGVVSCASLFFAIEIISAWYLRQYRNYVDGTIELLKIKAIFDKIMLLKFACDEGDSSSILETHLGKLLERDFNWPDRPSSAGHGSLDIKTLKDVISIAQKFVNNSKDEK